MTQQDIMNLIEEEDVQFVRLQFTDVWGNLKNIAVTPGQMDRVMNNKFSFDGSALFDSLYEYSDELYLVPDLNSFVILPWRPQRGKVAKLICDVCYYDGTLCEFSPRSILKKVVEDAKKKGYTFQIAPECEFFLFHTDENGNPTTVSHEKAGYLDVGPIDFGENARRDMVLTLEDMGFEIESSHHEKAQAQHEIAFMQSETLDAADNIMTFKFAVRAIAKRFGLYATFMPKPRSDASGSGMHFHISMIKDGVELFESNDKQELNDETKSFIAGILSHAEGLCAITNPIVNSYKRILSGGEAPNRVNWSTRGNSCYIKYSNRFGKKNVELRFPDTSANPYLALAVCIAAGMDGIDNKMALSESMTLDGKKLPGNLDDAVKLMSSDELICSILGQELTKIYKNVKKNEWKQYMMQVSDWEIDKYLYKM